MLRTLSGLAVLSAFLAAGCGGEDVGPTGTLSGHVTYRGKAVPEGSTVVVEYAGTVATAIVGTDGAFRIENESGDLLPLPVGEYRVAVRPTGGEGLSEEEIKKFMDAGRTPPPNPAEKGFPVPSRFRSTTDTPTKIEIAEGANEHDIELDKQ